MFAGIENKIIILVKTMTYTDTPDKFRQFIHCFHYQDKLLILQCLYPTIIDYGRIYFSLLELW